MTFPRRIAIQVAPVLLLAWLAGFACPAHGQAVADKVEFLRLSRDDQGDPLSLDTSIVRYREAEPRRDGRPPLEVDLVGAVHLGSKTYYDTLDQIGRAHV